MEHFADDASVRRLADLLGIAVDDLHQRVRERIAKLDVNAAGTWVADPAAERFRQAAICVLNRFGGDGPEEGWPRWKDSALGYFVKCLDASLELGAVSPGANSWPQDKPFPLPDLFCAALLQGYAVRWDGDHKEFSDLADGIWEAYSGEIRSKR